MTSCRGPGITTTHRRGQGLLSGLFLLFRPAAALGTAGVPATTPARISVCMHNRIPFDKQVANASAWECSWQGAPQ